MDEISDGEPKLRILLVENDADTAATFASLLRIYGHMVWVARDGPTALRMADDTMPDVAILDLALGDGINGCEVARQLKKRATEKMPFLIAVTGYGQEQDRRRTAEAGIHLHLVKPAEPELLKRLLARFKDIIEK